MREAASAGATYIQTPEMTGMLVRDRAELMSKVKLQQEDGLVAAAAELAKTYAIHLHIGSTAILREDGKVANRAFLFGPGGQLAATYDKIHMFDVDLDKGESWRESATYEPAREPWSRHSRSANSALPFATTCASHTCFARKHLLAPK